MAGLQTIRSRKRQGLSGVLLLGTVCLFAPVVARAHFVLVTPDAWMSQDSFGLPEKIGPCGDEGGGTATGKVTAFQAGQTISVTINEVITHPGHYRVALAINDRSELPAEPLVTPKSGDPCGSAAIENSPIFPILADNVLPHTQAFPGPQTFTVTLPTNVTCTNCTLQVLEFMSSHGAPCFYHHCADISIQGGPLATPTITPTPAPTTTGTPCATITLPKLVIGKLNTPPGDDTLSFKGTLTLPAPVSPALDPLANGIRVLVDDTAGTVLDLSIPGGPGWMVSRSGKTWAYRNKSPAPPGGISKIMVHDKSTIAPGLVRFAVTGKAEFSAVAPADLPATARLIITPSGGQCGDATFPSCAFNASGTKLRCR